ncbi:MAG: hypothetical protein UZ07_CHB004001047 [Chlorobi bacterium OLB7]|nr:MAG: hypothetical protein UZ07_CHB004001047 [Chlorobi bacterium OLB7]
MLTICTCVSCCLLNDKSLLWGRPIANKYPTSPIVTPFT